MGLSGGMETVARVLLIPSYHTGACDFPDTP